MAVEHRETGRHQQAFETWYEANRDFRKVTESYGVSEKTAYNWGDWFGWKARADKRDQAAREKADADAIKRRAAMLVRHRQAAELMQRRGIEHFAGSKVETARDAIAAIKTGVELERQVEGLPQWVGEILNADAESLRSILADLDGGFAARESAGDAAAVGAGAGTNGNGRH